MADENRIIRVDRSSTCVRPPFAFSFVRSTSRFAQDSIFGFIVPKKRRAINHRGHIHRI